MKQISACLIVALAVTGATTTQASAGGNRGAAVAAGVVGGLAIGALLGSAATARSAPSYVYVDDNYPPPRVVYRRHHVYD